MEFVAFSAFALYLLPWIVATARGHERHGYILALDLVLGWTLVGWCAAFAWALAQEDPRKTRPSRNFQLYAIDGGRVDDPPVGDPLGGGRAVLEVAQPRA